MQVRLADRTSSDGAALGGANIMYNGKSNFVAANRGSPTGPQTQMETPLHGIAHDAGGAFATLT